MSWRNVGVRVDGDCAEAVTELLEAAGAVAVTMRAADESVQLPRESPKSVPNEILEPAPGATPLWQSVWLEALFEGDANLASILAAVTRWFLHRGEPAPTVTVTAVDDQDWSRTWRCFHAPMRFGGRLVVVPRDWREPVDGVILRLDPGLAFGTGSHPTTALCLDWVARQDLCGRTVVDYGCGSGILGIAALLLGAARVVAVDHDPQARLATRENAAYNGIGAESARLEVVAPEALVVVAHDMVLANILADPLVALAPRLTRLVRRGGTIMLSGMRLEQLEGVRCAYPEFRFVDPVVRDGWVAIEGTRSSA